MNEHDWEPVHGLPATLPPGETILWQGAPLWQEFAKSAMRIRLAAVYFALLIVWGIYGGLAGHTPLTTIAMSTARLAGLGAVAISLLALFAWLVARTTVYTVTSRRIVIRFGIALPITIQIPFDLIETADVRVRAGRNGDISVTLRPDRRVAYLVLWPHARPWRMTRTQPTFRAVPDIQSVAAILGRALAASASQSASPIRISDAAVDRNDARMPATA
jgi:hypothetical protein